MSAFCDYHNDMDRWKGEVAYSINEDVNLHSDICVGPTFNAGVAEFLHETLSKFLYHSQRNGEGYFYLGDIDAALGASGGINCVREHLKRHYAGEKYETMVAIINSTLDRVEEMLTVLEDMYMRP